MVTEVEVVFELFDFGDFADDFGLEICDSVIEVGLFLVRVEFSLECFFGHLQDYITDTSLESINK